MQKVNWKHWNPGLDNGAQTLGEVKATLPGNPPEDISMLVKLLENPDSPIALPGAVTLDRHDCIHILLGRGLLNQDEAFVIGFTMGTSKDITRLQEYIFKKVSTYLYPKKYRFNKDHLKVYALGLEYGKHSPVEKIYAFPFEDYLDWPLGELRSKLGIHTDELKALYRKEQGLLPRTISSKRLPI